MPFLPALCLAALALAPAGTPEPTEARLLRFPDIHRDFVVFVHAGDIWRAPSTGGTARRLTSHPGLELFPQISQDGATIAFTAEYTGSRQVYVMPSAGGPSRQLTFYTDVGRLPPRGGYDNWVLGWSPDGKILVRMNRTPWGERMGRYFLVDPAGGLEMPLPLPHGGSASLSPDGRRLAYCPIDREFRTWKRTRGGRAQDIWLYDLTTERSTQITHSPATENFPMWSGDTLYFTSDRDGTLNLYAHDLRGDGDERRLTDFDEFDVLWPSLGPDAVVFVNGGYLYRFDLGRQQAERIPIEVAADPPLTAPSFRDVQDNVTGATISPGGSRVVLEARGELFSVPAKKGPIRNLTGTQGVREMDPTWSPDGKTIAYLSDATGEYEVYTVPQDGSAEPRRITRDGRIWRYAPVWSPDGKSLAFGDRDRRLWIVGAADGKRTEVDRGDRGDLTRYVWSPDSRWLAYEKSHATRLDGIALYSLEQQRTYLLGDGLTVDGSPVFSADGKYLFFVSNRDFNLTFSAYEFNYIYTDAARIYVAALDPTAPSLFPPESDEEKPDASTEKDRDTSDEEQREPGATNKNKNAGADEDEDEDEENAEDGEKKRKDKKDGGAPERLRIAPEGFGARTISVPDVPAGEYRALAASAEALFYVRAAREKSTLYRYDLASRKEAKVLDDVDDFRLAARGKKLVYQAGKTWGVIDAQSGQEAGAGKLDLSALRVKLDPQREWRQIYEDAWRITRDWFYDPAMHGKDWKALGARYRALLPDVRHRADLDFLLGELISELEAGHTYVTAGDEPQVPRVEGGMLGCEFAVENGRYRIAKIYAGENWNRDYRSPLTEPGVDVREGDYLLAIDGVALAATDNPYRLLENKAGQQVVLSVAPHATDKDKSTRRETVVPVASELGLRYLDWVRSRMALADKLSGGRIGYVHLPNTAAEGNRMLQKLFYSQVGKEALIVDDRYNGGGFIPDRMIEYFARRTLAFWARRGIESMRTPAFAHDGPKAMLINGYSSSGGDALPYFFKQLDLGPLIGTRTWGGLIGLSGDPRFVDGGGVEVPTFRIYDTAGAWVIENEGVHPDIEVVDLPERMARGGDPSLEKAVEVLLERLEHPEWREPPRPQPPVMPPLGRAPGGRKPG